MLAQFSHWAYQTAQVTSAPVAAFNRCAFMLAVSAGGAIRAHVEEAKILEEPKDWVLSAILHKSAHGDPIPSLLQIYYWLP